MKNPLTTREVILAAIAGTCLVLAIICSVYSIHLRNDYTQQQRQANTIIDNQVKSLRQSNSDTNKTSNYIETVCAEYRKLYGAYSDLRMQYPSSGASYAIPGSAKGNIDECYQPE
jgi:hypothetical protein